MLCTSSFFLGRWNPSADDGGDLWAGSMVCSSVVPLSFVCMNFVSLKWWSLVSKAAYFSVTWKVSEALGLSFCCNTFRCWSMPQSWFVWCCQESPGNFWGRTAFQNAHSSCVIVSELPPGVWSVRRDEYVMNTFAPWKKKEFVWSEQLYVFSHTFNSWVLLFWWVAKRLAEERCSFIPSATQLEAPLLCSWKIHLCQSPRRGSVVFFLHCFKNTTA